MKSKEIQKLIDRVVGTDGTLRIPSWWMHKILSDLVKYCKENAATSVTIVDYIESQLNLVVDKIVDLNERLQDVESHELLEFVSELPSEPKENIIYLVPSLNGEGTNVLTEWAYINNTWEQFGEFKADIDLTPYLKIEDSPFEKGDANNSAVLKGGNNQVISEGGVALGEDNVVGLKGWYYSSIYKENDNTISIYLSNEQKAFNSDEDFKTESQIADKSLPNLVEILGVNAVISLVNAGKYDDKFIVIGGSNGVVRLQTIDESALPFDIITGQSVINYEDYSIYCLSKPDAGIAELGKYSFAVGYNNKTTNGESAAFGYNNHAYGKFSFVEGKDNKAGYASHAEGRSNTAIGSISHAEGRDNVASGYLSHVEGGNNIAEGAESHAEGYFTTAKGARSHAEGYRTKANGNSSHAEGDTTKAEGTCSHAEGCSTEALGESSHAEGNDTKATGDNSHAEGQETSAEGKWSHAEGFKSQAIGAHSHAEGNDTKAEGINSHAEGNKSHSLGPHSHAEGNETKAEGSCAHAEGYKSQALGRYSHAEGSNTITKNETEHACGKHNSSTQSNDSAQATRFSIGIGTSDTNRKNAVEVKQNGDVYIIGIGEYNGTNYDNATDLASYITKLETRIKELEDIIEQITEKV